MIYQTEEFKITLEDNMQLMSRYPDNYFDLAVVDPPYGLNMSNEKTRKSGRFKGAKKSNWDNNTPNKNYFLELIRVSKNQIVFGGNYFSYLWTISNRGFIFWNKHQPVDNFADGELAWTSFDRNCKYYSYPYYGNIEGNTLAKNKRIHITQKPKQLYKWIFQNYAKPGDKILDTHLGSMSIAIALHQMNTGPEKMNLHLTGCELDEDYFNAGVKRVKEKTKQLSIFQL